MTPAGGLDRQHDRDEVGSRGLFELTWKPVGQANLQRGADLRPARTPSAFDERRELGADALLRASDCRGGQDERRRNQRVRTRRTVGVQLMVACTRA